MNPTSPLPTSVPTSPPADGHAAALVESRQALARQTCRYLEQLREFDIHRGYRRQLKGGKTAANTAHWLQIVCGMDRARAAEDLRVAYALLKMPAIATAFEAGQLSYRKVRALSRVADVGSERAMLDFARAVGDAHVETYCRRVRLGYTRLAPSPSEEVSLAQQAQQDSIVVYHNPACSKCRGALAILRDRNVPFDTVEYLREPLSEAQLKDLLALLDAPPAELVRKDANFRALGLNAAHYATADAVAKLLAAHPQLMQRPVVVRGDRAVLARPSERVEALL